MAGPSGGYNIVAAAIVTLGDLRRGGGLLKVRCGACGHVEHLDPNTLRLHGRLSVLKAKRRLKCSRCGARVESSRPDESPTAGGG